MDYSDWLTKGRLAVEEVSCNQARFYVAYAYDIAQVIKEAELKGPSILEFGCGVGLVPTELKGEFTYLGVDKFPDCIARAKQRNPTLKFLEEDIRDFYTDDKFDIACAFAFLKHFTLEELPLIFSKLYKSSDICVFSIPIGPINADDISNGFPHTFVTKSYVEKIAKGYGHEIISSSESIGPVELVFVTQRVEPEPEPVKKAPIVPVTKATKKKKKKAKK